MRLILPALAAAVLAGCGSTHASAIRVRIKVETFDLRSHRTNAHDFALRCAPTGGSMPEAARLCGDIARHPSAMLAPARSRSVCSEPIFGPQVFVHAWWRGRASSFDGGPGCNWPGGTALAVYWNASRRDTHDLGRWEKRLRCDDDPVLLAKPTPWRSVFACVHDLWTPRTAHLIAIAETLPELARLHARSLFPQQIGARRCLVGGTCEVNVTSVWKHPRVSFSESRPKGRLIVRHTWIVRIVDGRPRLA